MKNALCNGVNPDIFFEDRWKAKRIPFTKALEKARGFCDNCPVRRQCLIDEMRAEHGQPADHRIGVFAGMTGLQRHSLEKRNVDWEGDDPVKLRVDIPDRGDAWSDRHTALARTVITWLVENVDPGAEAPTATKLSRTMSARVMDMRRVYTALQEDQILLRTDTGALVRKAGDQSARTWFPRHLR